MPTNEYILNVKAQGTKQATKQLQGTNKAVGGLTSGARGMGVSLLKAGAGLATIAGTIKGVGASVNAYGKFEGINAGFENMARNAGFSSDALNKLRQATSGTASDMVLMEKANNAMMLEVVDSEEKMAELMNTAMRLGESLGLDTVDAVDSLVTGIGRQSKLMLDNLGIMIDTNKAYEDYAKELGKTTKELTDAEKKTAFNNASLAEAKRLVNDLGPDVETTGRALKRMGADTQNLAVSLGELMAPAVSLVADGYNTLTSSLAGASSALAQVDWGASFDNIRDNMFSVGIKISQTWALTWSSAVRYMYTDLGPDILKFFSDLFMGIWDGIKSWAKYLWEPLKLSSMILVLDMQKSWNSFLYGIRGLIQTYIQKPLTIAMNAIIGQTNKAVQAMSSVVGFKFTPIELFDVEGIETAQDNLEKANKPIDDLKKKLQGDLLQTPFVQDLLKSIPDATKTFSEQLSEIWQDGPIVLKVDDDGTVDTLGGKIEGVGDKTKNVFEKIKELFKENMATFNTVASEIGNTVGALGQMWGQQFEQAEDAMNTQIDLSNQSYQAEKDIMERGMADGLAKSNALIKLEKDRAEAEAKIRKDNEKELKKIRRRQASAEIVQAMISGGLAMIKAWTNPYPWNFVVAGLVATQTAMQVAMMSSKMKELASGGSFVANSPTPILVGEAGQPEHVQVTPLSATQREFGMNKPQPNINVNVSGNVMTRDYVRDELSSEIRRAVRAGLIDGVNVNI